MGPKLRSHLRHNVVGYIALFIALGGTGAYAANTIGSSDVIDDSLLTQDIKGKPATSTVAAENGTLTGADISGQPPIAGSDKDSLTARSRHTT